MSIVLKQIAKYPLAAILLTTLLTCRTQAAVIELQEVAVDYRNYAIVNDQQRNLLVYPEPPKEGLNLDVKIDLFSGLMYANSLIEAMTVSSQYRGIGLVQQVGFHLGKFADLGWYHHSQHVMDRPIMSIPSFPTEDAIQLRIYIYRK